MGIKKFMASALLVSMLASPSIAYSYAEPYCISYKVQKGDTLGHIAKDFNTTIENLVLANKLENPDVIRVGKILVIPQNTKVAYTLNKKNQLSYIVSEGDTLSKIARRFNKSVKELVKINGLKNADKIYVGQVITLEGNELIGDNSYIIKKGDTLSKISKRFYGENYGPELQKYFGFSDLEVRNLQIGTVLELPNLQNLLNNKGHTYIENKNYTIVGNKAYYKVQKGENLTKIVCYFYIAQDVHANNLVEKVAEYNNLDKIDFIKEDMIIEIPLTYENSILKKSIPRQRIYSRSFPR